MTTLRSVLAGMVKAGGICTLLGFLLATTVTWVPGPTPLWLRQLWFGLYLGALGAALWGLTEVLFWALDATFGALSGIFGQEYDTAEQDKGTTDH